MSGSQAKQHERDAFSTTQYTLLERWLAQGDEGRLLASRHIMNVYAHPLKVYYLGSSFCTLDRANDADDIVRGFFADRLDRDDFLHKWLGSGKRLRYWLITAFKHYLYEQVRRDARPTHRQVTEAEALADDPNDAQPEIAFHREVALSLVQEAIERTSEACEAEGLGQHWYVLVQRQIHGRSWPQIADELNESPPRLRVMARTAENRLRRHLRDVLAWPEATNAEIDEEIQSLLELLS